MYGRKRRNTKDMNPLTAIPTTTNSARPYDSRTCSLEKSALYMLNAMIYIFLPVWRTLRTGCCRLLEIVPCQQRHRCDIRRPCKRKT